MFKPDNARHLSMQVQEPVLQKSLLCTTKIRSRYHWLCPGQRLASFQPQVVSALVLFFATPQFYPRLAVFWHHCSLYVTSSLTVLLFFSFRPLTFPLQPKHQDTFSLAPQQPLTTINPIGHALHPNRAPTLKPSPVPRTIQAMPWEQRSLYNQWDIWRQLPP